MSVRQLKNGNWEARVRTPDGRRTTKNFSLKKDATSWEIEMRRSLQRGNWIDPAKGKQTLADVYEQYMKGKRSLKPKSLLSIESLWRVQIGPHLGHIPVSKINVSLLNSWVTNAVSGETAFTTEGRIYKAMEQVASLLDFAQDMEYIAKNPLRKANGRLNSFGFKKPAKKHIPIALNPDDLNKLAGHCGEFGIWVYTMALCGLRWAELAGLQVQDVSQDGSRLVICRTISEANGKFYELPTKSNKARTVPVPPVMREKILMRCIGKNPNDLVFPNKAGKPMSESNFRNRVFNPAIDKAGIVKIRIHDLRATCVSLMISKGANILAISRMIGHNDPSVTLRHYSHLFPEDLIAVSEELSSLVNFEILGLDFSCPLSQNIK